MQPRCPLCRTGELTPIRRELAYEGKVIRSDAYHCAACRESVLDGSQIAKLREAIRSEGLAFSEEEVERVLERMMLQRD